MFRKMAANPGKAKSGGSEGRGKILRLSRTTAPYEIKRRSPWIFVGLVAGIAMVATSRNFEEALAGRIELTFFLPMIVYMSDIIGTETLTLFVRELALRKVTLHRLFWREICVGLALGLAAGIPMTLVCFLWLNDLGLALTVGIAMAANGLVAVLTGMIVPVVFAKFKRDPAVGTDEIMTAISDNISILIYLATATLILFS
jgi:magnesium transporter